MAGTGFAHPMANPDHDRSDMQEGFWLMIHAGEQAPDFTLESTKGSFILSSLQGLQHAVLIFYPKDNTPG
jgi:hypothetical protein